MEFMFKVTGVTNGSKMANGETRKNIRWISVYVDTDNGAIQKLQCYDKDSHPRGCAMISYELDEIMPVVSRNMGIEFKSTSEENHLKFPSENFIIEDVHGTWEKLIRFTLMSRQYRDRCAERLAAKRAKKAEEERLENEREAGIPELPQSAPPKGDLKFKLPESASKSRKRQGVTPPLEEGYSSTSTTSVNDEEEPALPTAPPLPAHLMAPLNEMGANVPPPVPAEAKKNARVGAVRLPPPFRKPVKAAVESTGAVQTPPLSEEIGDPDRREILALTKQMRLRPAVDPASSSPSTESDSPDVSDDPADKSAPDGDRRRCITENDHNPGSMTIWAMLPLIVIVMFVCKRFYSLTGKPSAADNDESHESDDAHVL